jgi:hypothetical protein
VGRANGEEVLQLVMTSEVTLVVFASDEDGGRMSLRRGPTDVTLTMMGKDMELHADVKSVAATLDGEEVTGECREVLNEMWDGIRSQTTLTVSNRGRVVAESGTDADGGRELLDGVELPPEPIAVGDRFAGSLDTTLPGVELAAGAGGLPTRRVDMEWRLAALERGPDGTVLARIEAAWDQPMYGAEITDEGARADLFPKLSLRRWFDAEAGRLVRDELTGTIRAVPRDGSATLSIDTTSRSLLAD